MIAMNLDKLRQEIKECEGFRSYAYGDNLGFLTIGYGRMVDKRKGGGITEFEAEFMLQNDIDRIVRDLTVKFPWFKHLNDVRQRAIVNMAFQLGISGVANFKKMIEHLEEGRFNQAANEALDSNWAKQTPERAERVSSMIRGGVDV